MKRVTMFFACLFFLVVTTIGCATKNNQPAKNQPPYRPSHPLPVEINRSSPSEINNLLPAEVWDGLLKMSISNFYHRADTYQWDPWSSQKGTELNKEAQIVYGVLDPEDFWGYVPRQYWYQEPACDPGLPTPELKQVLFTIMKSEQLLKITYEWVKPIYQQTFSKLMPESQQIYLEALAHAQAYLKTFNYAKEKAYLEKIESDENVVSFAHQGPNGQTKFRKVEAFIFRRVHNGQLSADQMIHWANVLQKDFGPLADYPIGTKTP